MSSNMEVSVFAFLVVAFCVPSVKSGTECFGDLGCFSSHGLVPVPDNPSVIKTKFQFYNRQHRTTPGLSMEATTITSVPGDMFTNTHPTKFIVHGYQSHGTTSWVLETKDNLLHQGDMNVIVVDWDAGAQGGYSTAAADTYVVGAQTEKLIRYLQAHNSLTLDKVHVIGHSLGAQASGEIGRRLGGRIGRISGLDPAEPHFGEEPTSRRLDKTDAKFVDIIHSDAQPFHGIQGFGLKTPSGHIDFYPNDGYEQPGCAETGFTSLIDQLLSGGHVATIEDDVSCSHTRSALLFAESITSSCHFSAHPCGSDTDFESGKCLSCPSGGCPQMGYHADQTHARGLFYLSTAGTKPFCGHELFVEITMAADMPTTYGEMFLSFNRHKEEIKFGHKKRYYQKNNIDRHMLASNSVSGHVTSVRVRYEKDSLASPYVKPHKIMIEDVQTKQKTSFCTGDVQVQQGHPVTFTSTC